ncbi:hypothetical protein BKP35_17475 [Anaerobacillus arseniciselenatis]|uniref:HD-GYP domain-containing protein n=1 Tax=Anaerobacillus arseniciselenatis TaxID=85682 RepID=A0A1S2L8V2_9BACI|nr:HD domain-containing phosphohydrolase [Anaerobacillus arseniciselenatis]OIJ08700.1 hypothetical protein BKP35_17475 [Anaerobacillus arseniciselenatis]
MVDNISFDLVGKVLEQDIVSETDVLLLKKGTVLTSAHVDLLKKHQYKKVKVSVNKSFEDFYFTHINRIQDLYTNLESIKDVSLKQWFKRDESIVRFVQKDPLIFEKLYSIKKTETIYRHSANVGLIAFYLGKLLRFSYKNKLRLWQMGVLHDIGKMKLDQGMVENPEKLTKKQLAEYEKHPEYSWNVLRGIPDINVKILNAVRNHRERIDGSGYPRRLTVKYLHPSVQIISVADVIDELMTKQEKNLFEILYGLEEEALQNKLSPAVVCPFLRNTLRKHINKHVLLNDGNVAEVSFVFDYEPMQPLLYFRESKTFIDLRKFHKLKIVGFA